MNLRAYLNKSVSILFLVSLVSFCSNGEQDRKNESVDNPVNNQPDVITEKTLHDTDDPAIWINKNNTAESIVFGSDKNPEGAIYAFNLVGEIIEEKTIRNLKRPNNVDIAYNVQINDSVKIDILAFTERERKQIRFFSIPDMREIDNGGFPVFEDETEEDFRFPMGISLYTSPLDQAVYAIVGRKEGPLENYLYQYKIQAENSVLKISLVRKFGRFSGEKEIEAIAVDNELGYVYYSDEKHCIRKYYAEPSKGNTELACFGGDLFEEDMEGIAILTYENNKGYIIVSNQQNGTFNIFSREENKFIKEIDLNTKDTDGCEVVAGKLNDTFKNGLFVAMNNDKTFYFYDLAQLGLEP